MSDFLRKFILVFLIACIPLQGFAMQARMHAPQGMADSELSLSAAAHDCCPHDMSDMSTGHAQPSHTLGGECSHCPLCGVSLTSSLFLFQEVTAAAILHAAPLPHLSRFYPEQPQRPPLPHHA
ncbi:MAG: hypothetical protein KGZ83_19095 [Sulfuricella sp.]|nr:hypothetical protein [Sulfuricella sp.]